jgi:hypothetical protein
METVKICMETVKKCMQKCEKSIETVKNFRRHEGTKARRKLDADCADYAGNFTVEKGAILGGRKFPACVWGELGG